MPADHVGRLGKLPQKEADGVAIVLAVGGRPVRRHLRAEERTERRRVLKLGRVKERGPRHEPEPGCVDRGGWRRHELRSGEFLFYSARSSTTTAKTMNAIHATENNTVLARNRPKPLMWITAWATRA